MVNYNLTYTTALEAYTTYVRRQAMYAFLMLGRACVIEFGVKNRITHRVLHVASCGLSTCLSILTSETLSTSSYDRPGAGAIRGAVF
jgi:hydroxyacyl-ACP dehydratase HTD2-like protein with hotdog domain